MSGPRQVPIEQYATHAAAALAEGMCPGCQTPTMQPRPVTLADFEGTERTVDTLVCRSCGTDWWPAWILRPDAAGWSVVANADAVRAVLAARTWDGRWREA